MPSWCRRAPAILAVCAVLGNLSPASAASLFADVDAAQLAVRAKVEGRTEYPKAKLTVFHLRVTRALKGPAANAERIELAQEMLFASTKPLFTDGTETLVLAVPLPTYSSFQEALPPGTYWRWTERLATAADLVPLADPALTEAVAAYLAAADDPERLAEFLVRAITGPSARLRQDALFDVARRPDVAPLLDAGRLAPVDAWLGDAQQPPTERARTIVALARARAAGIVPIAERFAGVAGPLQAPAIDALLTMDRPPPVERLVALSRSVDEPMRLVAGRGLAAAATAPALDRLAELLPQEPSPDVRVAIMQAFGRTPSPRIVELAARELARSDKTVSGPASEALVRQGTSEAIDALRKTLESGGEDARVAAAFALKRVNRRETDEILEEIEATHPDPAVRRLCKLALGESLHEH
jgi:hypothetical protein